MWKSTLIRLFITATAWLPVAGQCTNPQVRREIRDLLPAERTRLFSAINTMYNNNAINGLYRNFSLVHYQARNNAHGVPAFLPWHRHFLYLFELNLKRIDSSVVLPYWDWSRDSQAPERSEIFTAAFFGGNGDSRNGYCVRSGPFANWRARVPADHCLQRRFDAGSRISSWYSPELMENMFSNSRSSYETFRRNLEGVPHASIHVNVGGDMQQMYSTNDPLFWMHHAFIDMLWLEWQKRNPNLANTYTNSVNSILNPFDVTVRSTFSTTSGSYCYTYPRYSGLSTATATLAAQSEPAQVEVVQSDPEPQLAARSLDASQLLEQGLKSVQNAAGVDAAQSKVRRQSGLLKNVNNVLGNSADDGDQDASLQFKASPDYASPTDRQDEFKLRFPRAIPRAFAEMNGFNIREIRKMEYKNYQYCSKFNHLDANTRRNAFFRHHRH